MHRVHLKLVQLSMSHLGGRLYGIGLNLTVNDKAYEYQNICFRHVDYQNCFLRIDCTIRSAALWTRLQRGRTFSILEIWWLGGCLHRWPLAHCLWKIGLWKMHRASGVLGSPHWEGLCKVCIQGPYFISFNTNKYRLSLSCDIERDWLSMLNWNTLGDKLFSSLRILVNLFPYAVCMHSTVSLACFWTTCLQKNKVAFIWLNLRLRG